MPSKYQKIQPVLEALPRGPAVDIGCGKGESLELLARLGFEPLYGYDTSGADLAAARAALEPLGRTYFLLASDATRLQELDPASVALIHGRTSFQYFACAELAQACSRVLRPGGHVAAEVVALGYYLQPRHLLNLFRADGRWRLWSYPRVVIRSLLYELCGRQLRLGGRAAEIGWTRRTIAHFARAAGLELVAVRRAPSVYGYLVVMRKP
jgi:SAM-dependent methyltransferase